ncbi:MAG: hypothetical protein AB7V43_18470 [Acidimicrobiia bacterium]
MQTCDARETGQPSTRAHTLRRTTSKPSKNPLERAISAVIITALVVTAVSIIGLVGTAGIAEAATARPAPPQEVVDAISAHFPPSQVENALAVTYCESRWLTNERTAGANKPNVGIFQINRVHRKRLLAEGYTWDDIRLNLDTNAKVAADLWRTQGWRPWTCKKALPTSMRRTMPTMEELLWVPPSEQPPAEPAPAEPAPAEPAPAPPAAEVPPAVIVPPPPIVTDPPVVNPAPPVVPPTVVDPLAAPPMPPSTDLLPGLTDQSVTAPSTGAVPPVVTAPPLVQPGPPLVQPGSPLVQPGLPSAFTDPGANPVIGDPLVITPAAAPILAMFSSAHRVIPIKRTTSKVPSLSTRIRVQTTVSL